MSVVLVIFSFKLNFSIHKELTNLLLRIAFANKQYAIGLGHDAVFQSLNNSQMAFGQGNDIAVAIIVHRLAMQGDIGLFILVAQVI